MFDFLRAFGVTDGIRINESLDGPFITGGASSPVGVPMPLGTVYLQPIGNGFDLWEKFGSGDDDWRVKEFVAKAFITEFFSSNAISETTSLSFQDKINATTASLPSGRYLIQWSLEFTNSDNNRRTEISVEFDGSQIASNDNLFGTGGIYQIRAALFFTDTISGSKNMKIQYRVVDSGTARIRRATIGYIKVL